MKEVKVLLFSAIALIFFSFAISYISATCTLSTSLLSQDPYPAVPGEEVKLVFQLTGAEDPNCGDISFEILPSYPFTLSPSFEAKKKVRSGTYLTDYSSSVLFPYKLLVDKEALEGENQIKVKYSSSGTGTETNLIGTFNITIEDVIVDFEVTIDSYSYTTNKLVLGIVNTGENNIQSGIIEIPSQENIVIRGGNSKILGDLDSNEDTTLTFEAIPKDGEITVIISYNDETGQRRQIEKKVLFSESAFENTKSKKAKPTTSLILLIITWLALIVWFFYKKAKAKKLKQKAILFRKQAAF